MSLRTRGEALGPVALITACVKFGSNLWVALLVSPAVTPFDAMVDDISDVMMGDDVCGQIELYGK